MKEPVPAVLIRPQGRGPFPAVVLIHPCGGINQTMYDDWAPWFLGLRYIVLVPDSLAPWHQSSACGNYSPPLAPHTETHPTVGDGVLDALGALRFLRSRQDVIPDRIAVIGWSYDGSVVTVVTSRYIVNKFARGRFGGFQAGIAVYPGCGQLKNGAPGHGIETPLLLLLGGSDDSAVPAECMRAGLARQSAGDPVDLHVYPGVTHSFDVLTNNGTPEKMNGTVIHQRYDAAATADAHTRVAQFLERHVQ